jgi:hypothetical protein
MPIVIKRDETGKNPKNRTDATAAATPAAKPAPKAAAKTQSKPAAGAKPKAKAAADKKSDMPKLIGLGVVIVLALGFFVWYAFLSGGGGSTDSTAPVPKTGPTVATPGVGGGTTGRGGITTTDGIPNLGKGLGGSEGTRSTDGIE